MDVDIHIFCLTVTYKNGLVKVIIGKIKKKYQLIDIQEINIIVCVIIVILRERNRSILGDDYYTTPTFC